MINKLVIAISIGALAVVIAEVSGIVQWLKYKLHIQHRIKPFDCPKCLAWWIAIVYYFPFYNVQISKYANVQIQLTLIEWLAMASVSSIASIIILNQIRK